jgi:outer membrane protein assembly factor BamB
MSTIEKSPAVTTSSQLPSKVHLRLWPAIALAALLWALLNIPGMIAPMTMVTFMAWIFGPMLVAVGLAIWWLAASRARWFDRILIPVVFIAALIVARLAAHPSMTKFAFLSYVLPIPLYLTVAWLVVTQWLSWPIRRAGLITVIILSCGYYALVRNEGTTGSFQTALRFRWLPTAEDKMLADVRAGAIPHTAEQVSTGPMTLGPHDWPAFRGPGRDGRLAGVRIRTDWKDHPPQQLWRHRIGPGWSSFAVIGDRAFTQEQRDKDELVVCYDVNSGAELWSHSDPARFEETMAGAGPRGTPTFDSGKIYAQGATGILNCLDASTGRVIWSHNVKDDSKAQTPIWGFSASPLVADGIVTTFAGGPDGKGILGYDAPTGDLKWSGETGKFSYCSTEVKNVDGVKQLLIATDTGLASFDPPSGKALWRHDWPLHEGMSRIVQPASISDTDLLLGTGFGSGTRRIHVAREGDQWTTKEVWTTPALNPYYNDLVIQRGYLYGFDNNFLICINLEDGKRKWKVRGYGNGQVLLLADQDLLLVLSEEGDVALVAAKPEAHEEVARFSAISGKTWNHPVIAGGKLLVRNGEEAACYQLTEDAGGVAKN